MFDVCLTPEGFTTAGASEVRPWRWGSPLARLASTLFNEKHRKFPKLGGGTQQIEDAEEQELALLWLAPCSFSWKTLLKSSRHLLESWGKRQKKWHPGRRKKPPAQPALKVGGAGCSPCCCSSQSFPLSLGPSRNRAAADSY